MNTNQYQTLNIDDAIPGQVYLAPWDLDDDDLPDPIGDDKHIKILFADMNGNNDQHCMVVLAPWE